MQQVTWSFHKAKEKDSDSHGNSIGTRLTSNTPCQNDAKHKPNILQIMSERGCNLQPRSRCWRLPNQHQRPTIAKFASLTCRTKKWCKTRNGNHPPLGEHICIKVQTKTVGFNTNVKTTPGPLQHSRAQHKYERDRRRWNAMGTQHEDQVMCHQNS